MIPSYTYIDTAQLWLWCVFPGCRLVAARAEPLPLPEVLGKPGV